MKTPKIGHTLRISVSAHQYSRLLAAASRHGRKSAADYVLMLIEAELAKPIGESWGKERERLMKEGRAAFQAGNAEELNRIMRLLNVNAEVYQKKFHR